MANTKINYPLLMTIFLGGIMIISAFGVMFYMPNYDSSINYNGFKIYQRNSLYLVEIDKNTQAIFNFHPLDVERFNFSGAEKVLKNSSVIYLTFNPNTTNLNYIDLARFQLVNDLNSILNIAVVEGVTEKNENYESLQLIDCSSATEYVPVIKFEFGNETMSKFVNNCLTLTSLTGTDLVRMKDSLEYRLLGVIR